jgi:hypothetical protein
MHELTATKLSAEMDLHREACPRELFTWSKVAKRVEEAGDAALP